MKVIIAGGRNHYNYDLMLKAIKESKFKITEVISGGCLGVDQMGEQWAAVHNIPIKRFIPNYNRDGNAAGMKRNRLMAEYADALIAIWDGESLGTAKVIKHMLARQKPIYIQKYGKVVINQ